MSIQSPAGFWQDVLPDRLRLMGHRNWVVIADSAYPRQTADGIETICTGDEHIRVVKEALKIVYGSPHVRPIVFLDAELPNLSEQYAPGVNDFRSKLQQVLEGQTIQSRPHEEIIARLDEAGKTFHVLLLKTTLAIPYSTVFLQLDCGYWSDEAEQNLRQSMASA